MDFEGWTKLLGKSVDDAAVMKALTSAGVKKAPKLPKGETFVQIELKGHGLEVIFTDAAVLDDAHAGGSLVLSGVVAKLGKAHGKDLYSGALLSGV